MKIKFLNVNDVMHIDVMQFKCRLNVDIWDANQSAFYLLFKF